MADFTTVLTTTADVDASIILEFDKQFIVAAAQEQVMDQFVSYKKAIDAKSIQFPKYARLSIDTTPLVETEDPASEALVDEPILLEPKEHGRVVTTTKLANLQTGGTADRAAARLVGLNGGRTMDRLAIEAAEASANSSTVTGGAENTLLASDIMTVTYLNELYNKLARTNIMPLSDGMYVAVMRDDVIHDLRNSAGTGSWQDIKKFTSSEEILKNQVGELAGFKIVKDNNITVNTDAGSGTVDTYKTLCMGFNALGKAESSPLQQKITGPFDKLARFMNMGWYAAVEYGIVDQDALHVGITASSVGQNAS